MALQARTKTFIVLGVGVIVLAFLLAPIHFNAPGPEGIALLSLATRAHLVERYEKPAQNLALGVDSLRKTIMTRHGMMLPSQDSVLRELKIRAAAMQQVVDHLRHPEKETFEEKTRYIAEYLQELMSEAVAIRDDITENYLK
jgi:hypothetical protein